MAIPSLLVFMVFAGAPPDGWDPGSCPAANHEALRASLGRAMGAPVDDSALEGVHGVIEGTQPQLRLALEVDGLARTIDATNCDDLLRAATLIVSISLDPARLASVPGTPAAAEDAPLQTPFRRTTNATTRVRRRRPTAAQQLRARSTHSSLRPFLHIHGGALGALMPGITGELALDGGLRWDRVSAVAGLSWGTPRTYTDPGRDDIGVELQLVRGRLGACYVGRGQAVIAPLCGGLMAGAAIGRGLGPLENRMQSSAVFGVWAGPSVAFYPGDGWVGFRASLRGIASFSRAAFETDPTGVVIATTSFGAALTLGFEFRGGP